MSLCYGNTERPHFALLIFLLSICRNEDDTISFCPSHSATHEWQEEEHRNLGNLRPRTTGDGETTDTYLQYPASLCVIKIVSMATVTKAESILHTFTLKVSR